MMNWSNFIASKCPLPKPIEYYLKAWLFPDEVDRSSGDLLLEKIGAAFLQKGGWEGWAQVEFGFFLGNQLNEWNVQREQPYSNGKGKVDFLITKGKDKVFIELKVETIFQSGNRQDDFKTRMENDFSKLYNVQGYPIAIGIGVGGQTVETLEKSWGRNVKLAIPNDPFRAYRQNNSLLVRPFYLEGTALRDWKPKNSDRMEVEEN